MIISVMQLSLVVTFSFRLLTTPQTQTGACDTTGCRIRFSGQRSKAQPTQMRRYRTQKRRHFCCAMTR